MPPNPPPARLAVLDRALAATALLAARSTRLSTDERKELEALAAKGRKSGRQGFTMADRARCAWLIRKAAPERLPDVEVPAWMRRRLRLPGGGEPVAPPPVRGPAVDPLDRLEKLGGLRGGVLTEAQFERQRAKILADPAIATWGAEEGMEPLDRISRVGELGAADVLTAEQVEELTDRILDAA